MKVCNFELDHCNGHRTCETLTSIETDCRNPCNINLSVSSLLRLKNWSYVGQALAYRISWEIYTPYAGDSGMLLHVYGKLTMAKSKSSRFSYNWVVSLPPTSMFKKKKNTKQTNTSVQSRNFYYICINIPSSPANSAHMLLLIQYARAYSTHDQFLIRGRRMQNMLMLQGFLKSRLQTARKLHVFIRI
jgi:hypothetical protein